MPAVSRKRAARASPSVTPELAVPTEQTTAEDPAPTSQEPSEAPKEKAETGVGGCRIGDAGMSSGDSRSDGEGEQTAKEEGEKHSGRYRIGR